MGNKICRCDEKNAEAFAQPDVTSSRVMNQSNRYILKKDDSRSRLMI